jgi:hypothetical protein
MSANQIRESIVDPNAQIAQGFPADLMPEDFEQQLAQDNALEKLVQYLIDNIGGGN